MSVTKSHLPRKYHDAVLKWRDTFIPDWGFLEEKWNDFFPKQPVTELCAFHDCSVCPNIEVGAGKGHPKFCKATEMTPDQAAHLLKAVRAQASTELGSIQQHRLTLARAQDETDQFHILRMMAEELRHGYQMFHILLTDDWTKVSDVSGEETVEEILNMRTGSHVLGAFNVDFDSFLDNATFCAVIDRVGKYQLTMQRVSAYRPMSESMPPMLKEEAFHLAAGVTPLRRWAQEAARDEGSVSMEMLQKSLNKWFPRGLDMFGDERGGGSNVRMGFKDMKNGDAQLEYIKEMQFIIDDINLRHVRARLPDLSKEEAQAAFDRLMQGELQHGVRPEELLRLPDRTFFRRRGIWAYERRDVDGTVIGEEHEFKHTMMRVLPESYAAGRDFKDYLELTGKVAAGEITQEHAVGMMPTLSRVGGACPCSNAVRWVNGNGNGDSA